MLYTRFWLLKEKLKSLRFKVLAANNKQGMEFVQVAILIGLAVALGIIFDDQITAFVNKTFRSLNG